MLYSMLYITLCYIPCFITWCVTFHIPCYIASYLTCYMNYCLTTTTVDIESPGTLTRSGTGRSCSSSSIGVASGGDVIVNCVNFVNQANKF